MRAAVILAYSTILRQRGGAVSIPISLRYANSRYAIMTPCSPTLSCFQATCASFSGSPDIELYGYLYHHPELLERTTLLTPTVYLPGILVTH